MCVCVFTRANLLCVGVSYFVFCVFPVCHCLVFSTSAISCLEVERHVSKMTCYVLSGTLNRTHSHTHSVTSSNFATGVKTGKITVDYGRCVVCGM